jgi:hypothetical protein
VVGNSYNKVTVSALRRVVELRKVAKIDHVFDRALERHIWLVSPTKVVSHASRSSYITATSDLGTVTFGANDDSLDKVITRALRAFASIGIVSEESIRSMEVS